MSIPGAASPLFLATTGAAAAFEISRSLRFNSGDSANLSRTPSSAGNRRTWTYSTWLKRTTFGTEGGIFSTYAGAHPNTSLFWESEALKFHDYTGSYNIRLGTAAVFRDPSAWYHIVLAYDSTESTASNRAKLWVNGVLQTLSGTTVPSNFETDWNSATAHNIGRYAAYFDGYMAEVNFIDATALDPTSFGAFDDNGVWQAKDTAGLTFGTNGFRLKFADNSSNAALGTDSSGNSNTWSVNNLTASVAVAKAIDLDGNDQIEFPGPGDGISGDFTMECFFLMDSSASGYERIFSTKEGSYSDEQTMIRRHTDGSIQFYVGNSSPSDHKGGSITAGVWHHAAIVRSSGTISYYYDGSRLSTDSYSTSFDITKLVVGGGYGSENFNGDVHGARFTLGQALYSGSSYTVPTSPITTTSQSATASNVKVLAGTTSTVNENAGTLGNGTNSGDPTAASAYPFGDPVNIDSLVDTPTNGTASTGGDPGGVTVGNYATWNPLVQSSSTFSNGNLQATTSGGSGYPLDMANFYTPAGTGKWYWEFELSALSGSNYTLVGMLPRDSGYQQGASDTPQAHGGISVYVGYDGSVTAASGAATAGTATATFAVGDILGWAFDAENGTLQCYKNGVSQGTQFTNIRTNIGWVFCVTDYDNSATATYVINFGQRAFAYNAPTNFKALNTANLPTPTIADGSLYFDTKLYTGNGSTQAVGGFGFSPDFLWLKSRSIAMNHHVVDTVRGTDSNGYLVMQTDATYGESPFDTSWHNTYGKVTALGSDGFTAVGGTSNGGFNSNSVTYAAWAWDAGTSTVTNNDGSIASQVRANPSAGFSIVSWTGGGATASIGTGLNAEPHFVIVKNRTGSADNWSVYTKTSGAGKQMYLNTTDAEGSGSVFPTAPTNAVINIGGGYVGSGIQSIAYCFAPVAGYSAMGSYVGSSGNKFIYTGFQPRWIMIKVSSEANSQFGWRIIDTARDPENTSGIAQKLTADNAAAENTSPMSTSEGKIDILSNGFNIQDNHSVFNTSSRTYLYVAFASHPFQANGGLAR